MNIKKLVDSLDNKECEELRSALWNRLEKESILDAMRIVMTAGELNVLNDFGDVAVIKEIRVRTGCSFLCAKKVVERYSNSIASISG